MSWHPPNPAPCLARVPLEPHGGPGDDPEGSLPPVILDLSTNVLPGGPDPVVADAAATAELGSYADPDARRPRRRLAEAWHLDPKRILLGPGAADLIHRVARCWAGPDKPVVIAGPTFGEYARAARLCGAPVYEVRPTAPDLRLDLETVLGTVRRVSPTLVFVCTPNNPTGEALDDAQVERLADGLPAGTLLVLDESYRTFAMGRLAPPHRPLDPRVLHLRSFTKDLAVPGLRIATAVGDESILVALRRTAPPWAVSASAMAALEAALEAGAQRRLRARWQSLASDREELALALSARGWGVLPSRTGFVLARVDAAGPTHRALRGRGIRVRHAGSFGLPDHLRIAATGAQARAQLLAAVDSLELVDRENPAVPHPAEGPRGLVLVRHGPTLANRERRFQGWSDLPLAPGVADELTDLEARVTRAVDLAPPDPECEPAWRPPRVWSSDLTRALQTATRVASGAVVYVDARLREYNFGAFELRTHQELMAAGVEPYRAWLDDPEGSPPPGGERLSEFQDRLHRWWTDRAREPNSSLVVVAHGGPLGLLRSHLLDAEAAPDDRVPRPGGLVALEANGNTPPRWRVVDTRLPPTLDDDTVNTPEAPDTTDPASAERTSPSDGLEDTETPVASAEDAPGAGSTDPYARSDEQPRHPKAPVPKQRTPGPYPVPPREKRKGLVLVHTGNGKGKTTAALGILLRARGRDMSVAMLQFIKTEGSKRGEHYAAERLGVEIIPMGAGFTWLSERIEEDRALARECWERCRETLHSGDYDIVIFDELTYALSYGWLQHDEVLPVIRDRPHGTHVVITGRKATPELIEFADLVTEMNEIKHPYRTQGIGAQPGLEL